MSLQSDAGSVSLNTVISVGLNSDKFAISLKFSLFLIKSIIEGML